MLIVLSALLVPQFTSPKSIHLSNVGFYTHTSELCWIKLHNWFIFKYLLPRQCFQCTRRLSYLSFNSVSFSPTSLNYPSDFSTLTFCPSLLSQPFWLSQQKWFPLMEIPSIFPPRYKTSPNFQGKNLSISTLIFKVLLEEGLPFLLKTSPVL